MQQFVFPIVVVAILMTGCVRIPPPQGFLYSDQKKMQAAYHWNVLANDVANRINTELMHQEYLRASVYVRHSCGEPDFCKDGTHFPFDQGFNELLTTQLVNFGIITQVTPENADLIVDYKVQVVFHQAFREQFPQPGVLTALTTGVTVLRDASWDVIAIATAATIDTLNALTTTNGHYEVIITTSITERNRYVMRTSDIYYINDSDFWQYQPRQPAAQIDLIGKNAQSPQPKETQHK